MHRPNGSLTARPRLDATLPIEPPLYAVDRINLIRNLALDVYQHKSAEGLSEMLPVLAGFSPEYVNRDNQFQGKVRKGLLLNLSRWGPVLQPGNHLSLQLQNITNLKYSLDC